MGSFIVLTIWPLGKRGWYIEDNFFNLCFFEWMDFELSPILKCVDEVLGDDIRTTFLARISMLNRHYLNQWWSGALMS